MRTARSLLCPILVLAAMAPSVYGHLSFNLVVDAKGNAYFIDIFQNSLMKVAPDGEASELVDLRSLAPEERLHALAIDADGALYVGGYYLDTIWKVSESGAVSTFFPVPDQTPPVNEILHLAFDASGALYVLEWAYTPMEGQARRFRVLKFSDPGEAPVVLLMSHADDDDFVDFHVGSMAVSADGTVYLSGDHRILKLQEGRKLEFAGDGERGFADGKGTEARFAYPYGMALDADGNLIVAELSGRIRKITPEGVVSILAGTEERGYLDGTLTEARFEYAFAVAVGPHGRLYIADYATKKEYRIRIVDEGRVKTVARIPTDGAFRK